MSIDLLRLIASSPLPMSFRSPEEIDKVRILRMAGLVIAFVPTSSDPCLMTGPEKSAKVLALTQKGREELLRGNYPDQLAPVSMQTMGLRKRLQSAARRARQKFH